MSEHLEKAKHEMRNALDFADQRERFQGLAIQALIAHAEEQEESVEVIQRSIWGPDDE